MYYLNGNALISIESDGTRTIEYEKELFLQYPLNVDIRVQSKCQFGYNSKTNSAVCSFCHESATTDGAECNYDELFDKIKCLPKGVELAIGCNEFTDSLYDFVEKCSKRGYICNLTINQGMVNKHKKLLELAINNKIIAGLGISYRPFVTNSLPEFVLHYPNTVLHVIAGIDSIEEVLALTDYKKILVLGEKNFGFNESKVDLTSQKHKQWYWQVHELFKKFDVVSFDNLGLEQLNVKRFLNSKQWNKFYQGEHSMYINAVAKCFSPSSRSPQQVNWDSVTLPKYFQQLEKLNEIS